MNAQPDNQNNVKKISKKTKIKSKKDKKNHGKYHQQAQVIMENKSTADTRKRKK